MSQLKNIFSNLPLISAGEASTTSNFFVLLSKNHFNGEEKKQFGPHKWATKF